MLQKRRSGRGSTKTSIGDEIVHLRGLDLRGLRPDGKACFRDRRPITCPGICCSQSLPIGFKLTALAI
jgi:hypothetical protein